MKDITGYEGLYGVTEDGRVFSYRSKKFLKPLEENSGYFRVNLYNGTSVKHKLIHRIVAETFLPNPNGLPEINHKDEVKENNCVDNLEFCTHSYNINYGTRNERVRVAKSKQVICVETGKIFDSATEAYKQTGIHLSHICEVCRGERKTAGGCHWRYVGGE